MAAVHPDPYVRLPHTGVNTSGSVLPAARGFRAGRGRGGNVWENDGEKREVRLNKRIWTRKKGRYMVVFSIFSLSCHLPTSFFSYHSRLLQTPPPFLTSNFFLSSPPHLLSLPSFLFRVTVLTSCFSSPFLSVQIICALSLSLAVIAVVLLDSTSNHS